MANIELATPSSLTEASPVGCLVCSAAKAKVLDESLKQKRAATLLVQPVACNFLGSAGQNGRGQVFTFDPWQDQKPRVVNHAMQVLLALYG